MEESKDEIVFDIEKILVLRENLKIEKKKVIEFQHLLSTTRALRLQDLHDKEIQKVEISKLNNDIIKYEKEINLVRHDVINKIILIENAASMNAILSRTAKSQKEEIVRMCGEIMNLEDNKLFLKKNIKKLENSLAVYANKNKNLKHDFLEGKFLLHKINSNCKINGKINENINQYLQGQRSSRRDVHEEGSVRYKDSDDVIGFLSSSLSEVNDNELYLPSSKTTVNNYNDNQGNSGKYHNKHHFYDDNNNDQLYPINMTEINNRTNNEKSFQKKPNVKNHVKSLSLNAISSQKSLFVGTGLGLRKDEMIKYPPKGSAKLILKNILNDY